MNKTLRFLLAILSAMPFTAVAQNMVHNPSFEEHTACPTDAGQLNKCIDWSNATTFKSNYYNSCDAGDMGVPDNDFSGGSGLNAYTGGAYVGSMYMVKPSGIPDYSYRAYLTGTLTSLQVGNCYEVKIHLAKGADNFTGLSIDGWGAYFYKNAIPNSSNTFLNVSPQINYDNYGVINNVAWTELTSTFIADSAYEKIVIGVFKDPSDLTVSSSPPGTYAFYFIDSVSVTPLFPASLIEELKVKIQVYPNPATKEIHVNNVLQESSYTLLDITGSKLSEGQLQKASNLISLENISPGIYFLNIISADGQKQVHKIVKQ
jgi:OOP family OmpA-OmpF porin